jgi:YVTN family beta-propeller protein
MGSTGGTGSTGSSGTSGAQLSSDPLSSPVSFNAVYVVNGGDSSLSVINADTNAVAGTIMFHGAIFPHHVNLSPDKTKLAVAFPGMDMSGGHHGGMPGMHGSLMILDALTGAMLAGTTLPSMNHNGAWSPDGTEVWTSQMDTAGTVLVLDPADLTVKQTISVGNSPEEVTFSHDGTKVFVANGMDNTVSVIDAASKAVLSTINVGEDPVGAWPGVDGVMYVTNETGKSVTAIKASDLSIVRTYNLGFTPGMAITAPSNDGTLWISNEDQGQVQINMTSMDMDMADVATGTGAHGIGFSADGSKCYVTNQFANSVSVVDEQQGSVLATVSVGTKPNGIAYRAQ